MLAIVVAAAVPAVGAMLWVEHAAMGREKAAVHDKHLNMARQLATTADVLARDRIAVLDRYAELADESSDEASFLQTVTGLGFRHLCLFDPKAKRIVASIELSQSDTFTIELAATVADQAVEETSQMLPARRDASGRPTVFITRLRPDGLAAIAALDPSFAADLAGAVAIGERGHAVIIDQTGQALGHPLPTWRHALKDLSAVKPVAAMLKGREGVTEFHSPAIKDDMIAGFAVAPVSGWGAMVVQPVAELRASVGDFFVTLIVIVAPLTLIFGALGGWLTARAVAAPIEQVTDAAKRFGAGEPARAPTPRRWLVTETVELGDRFNAMADAVCAHEENLRLSLERAEVADRAKTVFLRNMSHELRTPLNAVIGFAEMIGAQMLGPIRNGKYLEYANDIAHSGRHLLSLINDVLDLSKVEADRIEIDIVDVNVAKALQLAGRQISAQAKAHGLDLCIDVPADDLCIQADERRVHQILLNLLSNAVRFTPRGGEVRLSATPAGDVMRFLVADTGIGMSHADAQRAIEPFAQPNAALDPTERGAGLGLPLARNLALLHGGALSIDSAPGEGCRVTVDLPIAAGMAAAPTKDERRAAA